MEKIELFKSMMKTISDNANTLEENKTCSASVSLCDNENLFNQLVGISNANATREATQSSASQNFIRTLNDQGINGKVWVNIGTVCMRAAGKISTNTAPFTIDKMTDHLTQQAKVQNLHMTVKSENQKPTNLKESMVVHSNASP